MLKIEDEEEMSVAVKIMGEDNLFFDITQLKREIAIMT